MDLCPKCGSNIDNGTNKFCGYCGCAISFPPLSSPIELVNDEQNLTSLNTVPSEKLSIQCPRCGSVKYDSLHKFCSDCSEKKLTKEILAPKKQKKSSELLEFCIAMLCIALIIFFLSLNNSNFSRGKEALNEHRWDDAERYFKLAVEGTRENSEERKYLKISRDGQKLDKARKLYSNGKLQEVIDLLQNNDLPEAVALSDSVQRSVFRDSSLLYIAILHELLMRANLNMDSVLLIADKFRLYPDYMGFIRSNYPNGRILSNLLDSAIDTKRHLDGVLIDAGNDIHDIDYEMSLIEKNYQHYKDSGCIIKSFAIRRRFDTDLSGKGCYDALAYNPFQRCVLIADDDQIPSLEYERINIQLVVRDLGEKEYRMGDGYGYTTTEYSRTFETDNSYGDIEKDISRYKQLKRLRQPLLAKYEKAKAIASTSYRVNANKLLDSLRVILNISQKKKDRQTFQ